MFGWVKDKGKSIYDTGKKVIGTEEIKNNFNYIKEAGSILIRRPEQSKLIKADSKIKKTFTEYVREENITEEQLVVMSRNATIAYYIATLGTIMCVIFAFLSFMMGKSILDMIMQFATCFAIGSLLFVCSLRFAFDSYQIRKKELMSFREFLSKNDRLPKFYKVDIKQIKTKNKQQKRDYKNQNFAKKIK